MSHDLDPDPTYSTLENPTAAYPRDKVSALFDSEDSEPAAAPSPSQAPTPIMASRQEEPEEGVSLLYLGVALVGGGLLAVGVSGILALLIFSA